MTTELARRWALRSAQASAAHQARRLGIVRQFAQYCRALAPCPQLPPPDLLPYRYRRKSPYLSSAAEITQLRHAAQQLPSSTGLRAATYTTLFGLRAATGRRITEPLALERTEVDLSGGSLSIRGSKYGKSRWLPLHPTTRQALHRYAAQRDRLSPTPLTPSFFLSERGSRLTHWSVRATFGQLSQQLGLRRPQDHGGPRLHDLRHRFAIRTLVNWYRAGADVEHRLPQLAAYLGHAHVRDTYWYLSAPPALLRLAAPRREPPAEEEETVS